MTPVYKKTFNSAVLTELTRLAQDEWRILKSIDITKAEYVELNNIFTDPEYTNKDRFHPDRMDLIYNKVSITIEGQNGIQYINNLEQPKQKSKYFFGK